MLGSKKLKNCPVCEAKDAEIAYLRHVIDSLHERLGILPVSVPRDVENFTPQNRADNEEIIGE